ncbi:MAG: PAS domain-containing hybrid sensor histidine kinase/response regulator [Rhodospirillaceae bacterium]
MSQPPDHSGPAPAASPPAAPSPDLDWEDPDGPGADDALGALLEGIDVPAFVVDAAGTVLRTGPAGLLALGIKDGKTARGRDCFDAFRASLAEDVRTALQRLLTGDGPQTVEDPDGGPEEVRLLPTGGGRLPNGRPDPARPPTGAAILLRERYDGATAMALRDSEERFKRAFSAAGHGIVLVDPDARLRGVNRSFIDMVMTEPTPSGAFATVTLDPESWVGQDFTRLVFPGDIPIAKDLVRRLRAGKRSAATVRMRFVRQDDSNLYGLVTTATHWDRADDKPYLIVHITDRTAEHQAETRLREAKEEADKASRAKTRFLAAASHDLRQPLQALNMFLTALTNREDNPDKRKILQKADNAAIALAGLLNTLLDISKLDAGLMRCDSRSTALGPLLQRLAEEFVTVADSKGLEFRLVPTSVMVWADPALVEIILRNFLGNAVRYTKSGRLLLGVRQRSGPNGPVISIEVVDTGPGIPQDQLDLIFEDFHQVENPDREKGEGLGLGLAIVARVTKLLQAEITVKSNPGRGSCFSLVLPRSSGEAFDPTFEAMLSGAMAAEPAQGLQVMIVDDDPAVRDGLTLMLEEWDCDVLAFDSLAAVDDALDESIVALGAPDVIITDYRIGDQVTGVEAVDLIRSRYGQPIPAMVLTGDTAPQRLKDVEASGLPVIHKPARAEVLRSTISELVANQWREADFEL